MDEILIEEYRGGIVENVHRGYICGVTDKGDVMYSSGDIDHVTYLRSAAKPMQAVPIVKRGLDKKFSLSDKEVTIVASSHRGEPFHVEVLKSMMEKIEVEEDRLVCSAAYPVNSKVRETLIKSGIPKRRIYHTCSGKHLGILTLCKGTGCSVDNYWAISNPAQQEILESISMISGYPWKDIKIGIDGCGVPVFAMPIKYMANAYMRMACTDLILDKDMCVAAERITRLMNDNYDMIAGTNHICSILLMDRNIVAKEGAGGVYCFGLKDERLGFAVKVSDGSGFFLPLIVMGILEQINYKNKNTIKRLHEISPVEILNGSKRVVGENKIAFDIV